MTSNRWVFPVVIAILAYLGTLPAPAEDIRLNDCEIRGADSFGDFHKMFRWPVGSGAPIAFAWGQFEHDGDEFCHVTSNTFSAQIEYRALTPKAYLELKTYFANDDESSVIFELTPSEFEDDWRTLTRAFASIDDVEDVALPFPAAGVHFRLREHCGTKEVIREDGSVANVSIGDSNARFRVVSIGFAYGNWAANWQGMDFHPGDAQDNFDNVTLEHERATDYIEFTAGQSGQCTLQAYCRRKQGEEGRLQVKVNGSVKAEPSVPGTDFAWVDLWTGELAGGETIRVANNEWEESTWLGLSSTLHKSCVEFAHESRNGPVFRIVPVGGDGGGIVEPPPPPPPDTTPPILENVAAGPVSHEAAIVHFDASEDVQWRVEYGTTSNYGQTSISRGFDDPRAASLTGLAPDTTYHFRIVAADAAGNAAASPDHTFTTKAVPDRTAPVITNVQAAVTHNSATVTWNTSEPANSKLYYGRAPSTATWTGLADFVTNHSVTVDGLLPNTTYVFWVKGSDAAGNEGISPQSSFTTSPTPDTQAPTIIAPAVTAITQTSASVVWRTDEPTVSCVEYGTTPAYGLVATLQGTRTAHSIALSQLQPGRQYHYLVKATDAAGNTATHSGSFQTDPPDVGTVTGTVTRQDTGAPLAGATVTVLGSTGLSATCDGNGVYTIAGVPTGTRSLRFAASGWRTATAQVTVRRTQTVTRNFALVPVGTVYGYVQTPVTGDAGGRPRPRMIGLNGATVRIAAGNRTTQTANGYFAKPDRPADGYYALDDVAVGTHTVTVSLSGFVPQTLNVTVPGPGGKVRQDFSLEKARLDLSVTHDSLNISPESPIAGQRATVACTVVNSGNIEARTVRVRFLWNGAQISQSVIATLNPGASRRLTYSWLVPADGPTKGDLSAVVEPDAGIVEADASNNVATRSLTIVPLKPDVSILAADITHTPESPGCGQTVTIRATVKNMGGLAAENLEVALKRGDETVATRSRSRLNPGEHYQASMSWTVPAATYDPVAFRVVLDPSNNIDELDKTNNQAEHTVVPALPDLSVDAAEITSTPAAPIAGEDVRLSIKVRNLGGSKAYNIPLRIMRGTDVLSEQTISSLSAGSSTTRYFTWDIPDTAGDSEKLGVVLDPANSIPESNEANNAAPHLVLVTPRQIDLYIAAADITHTPPEPEAGHTATISVIVHNGGNVKASGVKVRFLRGGQQIGEKTISSITAGDDYTTKLYWSVPDGTVGPVTINVVLDPDGEIAETDESNNTASHSFAVLAGD